MADTLSSLIDSLSTLKRSKKSLEEEVKSVEKQIGDVEIELMKAMDADGIVESKSSVGKVSIGESVYPQVQDWDTFNQYILENKYLHLLERRPAVLAYRELLNLGRPVPGVLPYTKRKLTFKEN